MLHETWLADVGATHIPARALCEVRLFFSGPSESSPDEGNIGDAVCSAASPSISTDKGKTPCVVSVSSSKRIAHILLPHSLPAGTKGVKTFVEQFSAQGRKRKGSLFAAEVFKPFLFDVHSRIVWEGGGEQYHEHGHASELAACEVSSTLTHVT